ncbi:hypothetical protein CBR_g23740 [Chara braunii]|uniref:Dienelactone hydrolase domain-containing protein n=1 Tax=Chara braunii TaxID=69332 RepID=A0A388JVH7_CHABU|nr:hypothetical protein CBR_g23740 [Chara braunii]|eukprot:GBG61780.1 hypothetical protein CBR_g23740 [Chara braunii]
MIGTPATGRAVIKLSSACVRGTFAEHAAATCVSHGHHSSAYLPGHAADSSINVKASISRRWLWHAIPAGRGEGGGGGGGGVNRRREIDICRTEAVDKLIERGGATRKSSLRCDCCVALPARRSYIGVRGNAGLSTWRQGIGREDGILRSKLASAVRASFTAETSTRLGGGGGEGGGGGGGGAAMEKVRISRNGDGIQTFDAYLIGPKGAPGAVVVQEWWGVDYEIKNHASTIASRGFRALIPDLYRGKLGLEAAEAQHLMEGLDWKGAVEDIRAAAKYLKSEGSPRVGVTGFCMGGALTIAASVLVDEVDACVAFYGVPSDELADPRGAKKPLQAHFGEDDQLTGFADVATAKALEGKLRKAGIDYEVHIYPGVGHAFMNSSPEAIKRKKKLGMGEHDPDAADKAWKATQRWFDEYLRG